MHLKKGFHKEKSDYYKNSVIQTNLYILKCLREGMGEYRKY